MKRKKFKKIISTLVLSTIFLNVTGMKAYASKDIMFKNLSIEDGLSQATVDSIMQDSRGYMWFSTNDGLNRYNGYKFKVYKKERDSSKGLTSNYTGKTVEDKNGFIWVATDGGLNKIDVNTDKITHYLKGEENGNLSNNNTNDILITKDGRLLVSTYGGIDIYNEKTDKFERFTDADKNLRNKVVFSLAEDKDGFIWAGTEKGLDKLSSTGERVESFIYNEEFEELLNKSVRRIFCDDDGLVWVGNYNDGLKIIDTVNEKITNYINDPNDEKSLPSNYVKNFLKDDSGDMWLCTGEGLAYYSKENDNFKTYRNSNANERSLINDETISIYKDRGGLIWVGTYAGISIFDPSTKIDTYKKDDQLGENTLSENVIHGIYEDKNGYLWVGTNSKGVNVINQETNKYYHINTSTFEGYSNNSTNVITGKDNYVYIGNNNGLNIINIDTKEIEVIDVDDGLVDKFVKTLLIDSNGSVWIGTTNGFNIYNPKDKTIKNISEWLTQNGVRDMYSYSIFEDSEGIYWLGTFYDGGLIKIDPKKEEVKIYYSDETDSESLSDDVIGNIIEDKQGNLWLATRMGLNKFDKNTEKFKTYTIEDGLPNNYIYGILIDNNQNLWMSTNSGISKYDVKNDMFVNLDITDGLQGNEFNGNAYFKSKSGKLYFGGISGLNAFYPDEIINAGYIPKLQFDTFKVNGKVVSGINNKKFNHTENTINVKIFLPDYKNSNNIKYYYKDLDSDADEWIHIESNEVIFSNLAPDKYNVAFKARSTNGFFSDQQTISFTIKPPFWKSKFAFMLLILIVILIFKNEQNKRKKLDVLVAKRTKALSEEMKKNEFLYNKLIELEKTKNSYFVNLSHELRTPLNVLSSTQQLVVSLNDSENGISNEKLNHYMEVVRRNISRLLKIINDLIDTSKIDSGKYNIDIKEHDIVSIVEDAALTLTDYSKSKGIELIVDPYMEEKNIMCDDVEIERCIVNLVSNAIKHTPEGGNITVTLKDLDDSIEITVEDTGIGIPKECQERIFDRFSQVIDDGTESKGGSGLGLTITKKIVTLHHGKIFVESELGKGSKFIIILPVTHN